jgi:hypothetical protein
LLKAPALSALPTGTLNSLIAVLPTNSTLQDLLSEVKAAAGVEVTTGEAIGLALGDAAANPDVLSHLLSQVASLLQGTNGRARWMGNAKMVNRSDHRTRWGDRL